MTILQPLHNNTSQKSTSLQEPSHADDELLEVSVDLSTLLGLTKALPALVTLAGVRPY